MSFAPDASIFTVTEASPALLESYLRRMSFLHRGVRFRLTVAGQTREYHAPRGILDLFDSIAAPYQLMHAPIHVEAEEGSLRLEAVFAYQSWSTDEVWCFVNNGRAVEGGTHEDGFRRALKRLRAKLKVGGSNGVVALMSIAYPEVVWQGCIKSRIGNPELRGKVSRLVVGAVTAWAKAHPEVARQLAQIRTFTFPETWYAP